MYALRLNAPPLRPEPLLGAYEVVFRPLACQVRSIGINNEYASSVSLGETWPGRSGSARAPRFMKIAQATARSPSRAQRSVELILKGNAIGRSDKSRSKWRDRMGIGEVENDQHKPPRGITLEAHLCPMPR